MNNFDLRKYLAEGRLRVNEGDMDHLMQDLEGELKRHDWFYYMADDSRSYNKGILQQQEIKRLLKMLNNSPEAVALYNKYAPVQDGIDLRIKEEKIEEAVELPKDIKWEFDDVIDQMDAYNATISLIGHSKSTGKDYTASAEASKGGEGGDWDWMEVDEVEEETIAEEYNVGKGMEKDHDFDAMLAHALKLHAGTSIEVLKKVAHDFTDVNYHREVAYLEDAIDMLEAGKHEEFEDSLKLFKDEVEKTVRSFKESIKEGQGDDHHYIKVPTKEYKKAQAILNQNIDPTYVKMEVVDNDGAGNVIFYFIFKHEDGFDDMYDDSGDQDSEFYQEPEEDPQAFIYDAAMDLRANNITVVSHSADDLAEGDYDPDQEQLDDEDEIFMPMDDEGRPLEEALNPEVTKAVNRFIKGLAKKYDYPERDAVFAIQAALKQRSYDNVNEDLDIGHQDDEPGMLKADLYKIGKYAMELYKMMDSFEGAGEVDFPHWWQSKINTAKNMIDGAKHYLEFELKEPVVDATVDAADVEESIDREFHSTSKTSEHPNWEDLSAVEIQDYIDANPDTLWGRSLSIAKMVLAQKIDATTTEDNLEEIGMFNDPIGYEKSQPETPVFTKEYVGKDAYNILKNGKKLTTLFGSEGEANAYINKRNRELKEEETSFFTKDVKDAVISKLMDQLKK